MNSLLYLSCDGDKIGQIVGRARLADDEALLRDISGKIEAGNKLLKEWAEKHRGSCVESGGDESLLSIPPDAIHELPEVREEYHELTGATLSVGVGIKISDSSKALLVAKVRGGDSVVFYTPEIEEELKEIQEKPEGEKIAEEYLNKSAPAMNQGANAGFSGATKPSGPTVSRPTATQGEHSEAEAARAVFDEERPPAPEMTHAAKDAEGMFHEAAAAGEEEDVAASDNKEEGLKQIKVKLAQALQMVRSQVPVLEQIKSQAPDTYQAVMGLTQAVIALARATKGPEQLNKSEVPLAKMALVHDDANSPKMVWRVQDDYGDGPYQSGKPDVYSFAYHNGANVPESQPSPIDDFEPEEWSNQLTNRGHIFGFEKPEHATAWFGKDCLDGMAKRGYTLQKVPASRIYRSRAGGQILFKPHPSWGKMDKSEVPLSKAERKPWWHKSYPPAAPTPEVDGAVKSVKPALDAAAKEAGLASPIVHFTSKPLGNDIGKFVKGTAGTAPLFVINPQEHHRDAEELGVDHRDAVYGTLFHELGHAICEHRQSHPPDEEGVVEAFAHRSWRDGHHGKALATLLSALPAPSRFDKAEKSDKGISLVHYSVKPGLKQVDVKKMGTGAPAAEYKQGLPEVKRAYYYRAGSTPEPLVTQGAKAVYSAKLDSKQKLYDLGVDPDNLYPAAREQFLAGEGLNSPGDTYLHHVKKKGYYGYHNSQSALPHVVALFYPHPVTPAKLGKAEPLAKMALIHDNHEQPKMVWRVQDELGCGPYNRPEKEPDRNRIRDLAYRNFWDNSGQPDPRHDFVPEEWDKVPKEKRGEFLFGFEHPDHAKQWFGEDNLAELESYGIKLQQVPASQVYRSTTGSQIAFKPHRASHDKPEAAAATPAPMEKGKLPMPETTHRHEVVLPPGSVVGNKVKVKHSDNTESWKQVGAGQVLGTDPAHHPVSSIRVNSR